MKAKAPSWVYWPALLGVGFQLLVKTLKPSEENHDADCWLIVTAIRTRITSTSRPDARVRMEKPRSPSGRRCSRAEVDPAEAGSTPVIALTTASPPDLPAPRQPLTSWLSG